MKNKSDGKWFGMPDGHEYYDVGPFDTKEEAVKEMRSEEMKDFSVGKVLGYLPYMYCVADDIAEQASENGAGDYFDYPNLSQEKCDELDQYLTECLQKWLVENDCIPNFGEVTDVEFFEY